LLQIDPNLRPEMLDIKTILEISKPVLNETNILLPSGEEAEMLAGIKGEKAACLKLLEKNPNIVVLKQEKRGASVFVENQKEEIHIPAFNVDEIDPTGAGDSFGGAFIVGYLQGWSLEDALKFANATGALNVNHFGPMSDDSYAEVISLME